MAGNSTHPLPPPLPRHPQVTVTLTSQLRRQLHTLRPGQLAGTLRALASFGGRWNPGRRFLYDFVTQSRPALGAWRGDEACRVLWSFAMLGWAHRAGAERRVRWGRQGRGAPGWSGAEPRSPGAAAHLEHASSPLAAEPHPIPTPSSLPPSATPAPQVHPGVLLHLRHPRPPAAAAALLLGRRAVPGAVGPPAPLAPAPRPAGRLGRGLDRGRAHTRAGAVAAGARGSS
jgi:hypothetical protein